MLSVCVTPPDRPLIFKSITSSVTLQTTGKSGKISVKVKTSFTSLGPKAVLKTLGTVFQNTDLPVGE